MHVKRTYNPVLAVNGNLSFNERFVILFCGSVNITT